MFWLFYNLHGCALSRSCWTTRSGLAPFPGCQGSCGIVPNGPAGSVISFSMRQGLVCSLNTDLNYVTLAIPQLHPFLNHQAKLFQLLREDVSTFWVYSHRQIRNQAALSPGPETLC